MNLSPSKLGNCECGCGRKTNPAPENRPKAGWIKGEPVRFISGHNNVRNTYKIIESGCWQWQGKRGSYGKAWVMGKTVGAHRHIYEKIKGAIPKGMHLDHLCRNTMCVNPEHLEIVTVAENTRRGLLPKLTIDIVLKIKAAIATAKRGDFCRIAERFGVSPAHISQIKSGRHWKDVMEAS